MMFLSGSKKFVLHAFVSVQYQSLRDGRIGLSYQYRASVCLNYCCMFSITKIAIVAGVLQSVHEQIWVSATTEEHEIVFVGLLGGPLREGNALCEAMGRFFSFDCVYHGHTMQCNTIA